MKDQQSHRPSARATLSLLAVVAVAILSLLSVLLSPTPARANSAPTRWMPGSGGLVVPTTTQDVKIERELLSFDLVSSRTTAQVKASYDLTNVSGREVELDAIFIGPGGRNLVLQKQGEVSVLLPSADRLVTVPPLDRIEEKDCLPSTLRGLRRRWAPAAGVC